jgi:predicted ribonuclease YlaK
MIFYKCYLYINIMLWNNQGLFSFSKHKVDVPFEAIEEIWQGSCKTGKKETHPVKFLNVRKLATPLMLIYTSRLRPRVEIAFSLASC